MLAYIQRDELGDAVELRIECLLFNINSDNLDECYDLGYHIPFGCFIQLAFVFPIVAISSLILSCHGTKLQKWKDILSKINHWITNKICCKHDGHDTKSPSKVIPDHDSDLSSDDNDDNEKNTLIGPNTSTNDIRESGETQKIAMVDL